MIVGRQYDNYLAWYLADKEPQAFQDVQLKGDKLVGTIRPQEHAGVTATCEATLKAEDQCVGWPLFAPLVVIPAAVSSRVNACRCRPLTKS